MDDHGRLLEEHRTVTRRYFVQLGAAGVAGLACGPLGARGDGAVTIDAFEVFEPPLAESATGPGSSTGARSRLVGTWRLVSILGRKRPAPAIHPLGRHADPGTARVPGSRPAADPPAHLAASPMNEDLGSAARGASCISARSIATPRSGQGVIRPKRAPTHFSATPGPAVSEEV
jgi:hypothetical protein